MVVRIEESHDSDPGFIDASARAGSATSSTIDDDRRDTMAFHSQLSVSSVIAPIGMLRLWTLNVHSSEEDTLDA